MTGADIPFYFDPRHQGQPRLRRAAARCGGPARQPGRRPRRPALAAFPGFAELKRSLRERPQLRSFGVNPGTAGTEEDWHASSRKTMP